MAPASTLKKPSAGKIEIASTDPTTPPHQTAPSSPGPSTSPTLSEISTPSAIRLEKMKKYKGDHSSGLTTGPELLTNDVHQKFQTVIHENAATNTDSRGTAVDHSTITRDSTKYLPSNAYNAPIKTTRRVREGDASNRKASAVNSFIAEREYQKEVERHTPILTKWIGTSQYFVMEGLALQKKYRDSIVLEVARQPYQPGLYIELSRVDHKLGFCDIGAANAHRALILIKAGRGMDKKTYPKKLGAYVCTCVGFKLRLKADASDPIFTELEELHVKASRELLHNLLGSGAFWEGLMQAREVLKLFPGDEELVKTRSNLKDAFESNCRDIRRFCKDMKDTEDVEATVAYARRGKIYQKPYPWLDKALYSRSSAIIAEANQTLGAVNCEVRKVEFRGSLPQVKKIGQDVGPLGVFATENIREGELLMVDKCFATVSDVPSSYLAHCDACHGSLLEPYMHPIDVIKPACCDKVAYCSTACYETALNGYHRVVCGKDIEWLYQDSEGTYGKKAARDHSRSLLFLRVMCTVLSDRRYQREMGETPTHPLLHPLITRMTGYNPPPGELHPGPGSDWMYSENIVIPHRILQLLKVDIFKSSEFTPEVIQTIYWRLDNNACGGIVNLSDKDHHCRSSSTGFMRRRGGEHEEETLSLNPNYLFFNHSCEPNVNWRGSTPNPRVGTSWLKGLSGEILRPGCSAVWCIADKDVKKGEELKISYVGTPLGHDRRDRMNKRFMLTKWFHGGCGCNVCVREDETRVMDEDCSDEESNEDNEVGGEGSEERSE